METCSIKIQMWRVAAHPASSGLSGGESLLNSKKQEGPTQRHLIAFAAVALWRPPWILSRFGFSNGTGRSRSVTGAEGSAEVSAAAHNWPRSYRLPHAAADIIARRRWCLWWNQARLATDDLLQSFLLGFLLSSRLKWICLLHRTTSPSCATIHPSFAREYKCNMMSDVLERRNSAHWTRNPGMGGGLMAMAGMSCMSIYEKNPMAHH